MKITVSQSTDDKTLYEISLEFTKDVFLKIQEKHKENLLDDYGSTDLRLYGEDCFNHETNFQSEIKDGRYFIKLFETGTYDDLDHTKNPTINDLDWILKVANRFRVIGI